MRLHTVESPVESVDRAARFAWWRDPVVLGLLAFLAVCGIVSLRPGIATWGLAPWASVAPHLRYALLGAGVLVCVPVIARALDRIAEPIGRLPGISIAAIVLAAAAFVLFRVHNHANGDGYFLLGYLQGRDLSGFFEQITTQTSQLGDLLLRWGLGKIVLLPLGLGWESTYVVTSVVAGIAGLWGILRFARLFGSDQRVRLFVIFGCLSAGPVYFWFGHVESYTLASVAGLWACVLGAESLGDRRKLTGAWAALAAGVVFHAITISLLPMLVYASLSASRRERLANLRYPPPFVVLTGFLAAGIAVYVTTAAGANIFVPLVPTRDSVYSAFSRYHLTDMINVLLRAAPLGVIALLSWPWRRRPDDDRLRGIRTMLAAGAAGTWYFTFWMDPTLGAPRDWDLLALPAFPLTLWAAGLLAGRYAGGRGAAPRWAPAAALAALHIGVLVTANQDPGRGTNDMNILLINDVHYTKYYHDGSRLTPWGTILLSTLDRPDLAVEYFRRRTEAKPDDRVAWRNLGWSHYRLGHGTPACRALESGLRADSTNLTILPYLGMARLMVRDWTGARDAFERKIALQPENVEALFGAGVACGFAGDESAAAHYLSAATAFSIASESASLLSDKDSLLSYTNALARALEDSAMTLPRLILVSQLCLLGGTPATAVRAAQAATELAPESPDAHRQLALCMSSLDANDEALKEWSWYQSRRPDDPLELLVRGVVARKLGRLDVAIKSWEHAATVAPHFGSPCLELSKIYRASGDTLGARTWALEYERRQR